MEISSCMKKIFEKAYWAPMLGLLAEKKEGAETSNIYNDMMTSDVIYLLVNYYI